MKLNRCQRCIYAGTYVILLLLTPHLCQAQTDVSVLVSPFWLSTNLKQQNLLIIDTRDALDYEQRHIPGAINLPVDSTFAVSGKTYRVGNLQQIRELFGRHGITRANHIIIYDNGSFIDAARLFWVLEVYGHQRVSVMNGGIKHWIKYKLPTEQVTNQRSPTKYIPNINHHRLATKTAMQIALSSPAVSIIDARTHGEYIGNESIADRSGHIPGAINIPWTNNMKQEGDLNTLLAKADLAQQYKDYKDKRIITYCNRGKQSALTYFSLRHLGYDVSVYDGAWLEWANDQSLPIE